MTIVPQNDCVLCKLATAKTKTTESGLVYESNDMKLYEIVSIGRNVHDSHLNLKPGDLIAVNSTGTLAKLDDVEYYIFKLENIAAKAE